MTNLANFGSYNVDICLCIDKTGSMKPIIDTVKNNALNLYEDITRSMEAKGKHIGQLRIRVIWFGDYLADGEDAMFMSDIFTMPEDMEAFRDCVHSVSANGGGDTPEDGLEALVYAMKTKWCQDGWKKRHIIALFTDAPVHDLGYGKTSPYYPKKGMPDSFAKLYEMWGDGQYPGVMNYSAKRLLLFAPQTSYWQRIADEWENVIMHTAAEAGGLSDVTYNIMLDTIVNSVG